MVDILIDESLVSVCSINQPQGLLVPPFGFDGFMERSPIANVIAKVLNCKDFLPSSGIRHGTEFIGLAYPPEETWEFQQDCECGA